MTAPLDPTPEPKAARLAVIRNGPLYLANHKNFFLLDSAAPLAKGSTCKLRW